MAPVDSLALAAKIAAADFGEPLPVEAAAWLRTGLRRFLRGDAPLEVCLQLTTASRLAARNRALRTAAAILDEGRGISPWQLAGQLEAAIHRYESVISPCMRRDDTNLSSLNSAIQEAFATRATPLRSCRRLYELLLDD